MTIKKILLSLIITLLNLSLSAQNSISSDPNGIDAIQKIVGIPTSPSQHGYLSSVYSTQYITTGSTSTERSLIGVSSLVNNSTSLNMAILGVSSGSSTSYTNY